MRRPPGCTPATLVLRYTLPMMKDKPKRLLTRKRRAFFEALGEEAVLSELDNRKYEPELHSAAIQWLREKRESQQRHTILKFRLFEVGVVLAAVGVIVLLIGVFLSLDESI